MSWDPCDSVPSLDLVYRGHGISSASAGRTCLKPDMSHPTIHSLLDYAFKQTWDPSPLPSPSPMVFNVLEDDPQRGIWMRQHCDPHIPFCASKNNFSNVRLNFMCVFNKQQRLAFGWMQGDGCPCVYLATLTRHIFPDIWHTVLKQIQLNTQISSCTNTERGRAASDML